MNKASQPFDFSQFVPGFDFLKNLAAGASGAGSVLRHPEHGELGGAHHERRGSRQAHPGTQDGAVLARAERPCAQGHDPGAGGAEDDAVHPARHERAHGGPRGRVHAAGECGGRGGQPGAGSRGARTRGRARGRRGTRRGGGRRGGRGTAAAPQGQAGRQGLGQVRRGRCRRRRGRPAQVVGFADRAVPADREHRAAGRGPAQDAGRDPAAGRRRRQGHGNRERLAQVHPRKASAAAKRPAAKKPAAAPAARKRTGGRR